METNNTDAPKTKQFVCTRWQTMYFADKLQQRGWLDEDYRNYLIDNHVQEFCSDSFWKSGKSYFATHAACIAVGHMSQAAQDRIKYTLRLNSNDWRHCYFSSIPSILTSEEFENKQDATILDITNKQFSVQNPDYKTIRSQMGALVNHDNDWRNGNRQFLSYQKKFLCKVNGEISGICEFREFDWKSGKKSFVTVWPLRSCLTARELIIGFFVQRYGDADWSNQADVFDHITRAQIEYIPGLNDLDFSVIDYINDRRKWNGLQQLTTKNDVLRLIALKGPIDLIPLILNYIRPEHINHKKRLAMIKVLDELHEKHLIATSYFEKQTSKYLWWMNDAWGFTRCIKELEFPIHTAFITLKHVSSTMRQRLDNGLDIVGTIYTLQQRKQIGSVEEKLLGFAFALLAKHAQSEKYCRGALDAFEYYVNEIGVAHGLMGKSKEEWMKLINSYRGTKIYPISDDPKYGFIHCHIS